MNATQAGLSATLERLRAAVANGDAFRSDRTAAATAHWWQSVIPGGAITEAVGIATAVIVIP